MPARSQKTAPRSTRSPRIVLGLMSGTSADGIDAVTIAVHGRGERMKVELLGHIHRDYPRELRRRLLAIMAPATTTTEEVTRLHAEVGEAFAAAAKDAIARAPRGRKPTFIGLSGQTVCHLPGRRYRTATLQLGEASRVAERTGLPVVCEFRQSDVAAGGQGAPLVPWTDWVLFRHPGIARAVQNIGGGGNVTWVPPRAAASDVVAFDTGPGNMMIDELVALATRGRERFDRYGRRAARGRILEPVLRRWMAHSYIQRKPPKTTGREEFGRNFVVSQLPVLRAASRNPDDWIATATAFTARSIAQAYRRWLRPFPKIGEKKSRSARGELILCGGGARNATLAQLLVRELPEFQVRTIDALGIPAEAKEALSFAMLAAACIDGVPGNLPQVTEASRPAVLGRIVLPSRGVSLLQVVDL